ncbi:MAG: hypothetical protein FWB75_07750, partial [Oscillospiraceae bacterium]|nr:hypothetical protein [Oscillospiraceae bacterium]
MKILTRILAIILVVCLFTFATALAEDGNGEPGNGSIENGNGTPGNGNGTPGNGNGEPGNGNGNGGPGNGNGENNGNGEPPPPPPPPPPPNQNEQLQRELAYWIARAQQLERQLEQEQNDPTQPVPRRPLIHVTDPLWIEMEAGSRRTISFTLRNMGADHATAIVTTADMSEARGITGVFMDAHHSVASLNARTERTFAFQITVNESVTDGFYSIAFNHEYLNARNERITSTSHVTIRVTNQAGNVSLTDISSSPSHVPAGDNFNLSGTIRNDSRAGIRDVSVSITSGMASDGIFLRDSTNVVSIPNLAAGSTHNFSIGFTSSPNAASGAYPLGLEFSYTDSAGQRQTRAQTFFISVTADEDEEEDDTSADVIITNISRPTGAMRVAQEFEMTVTLRNTGENTARNLRVDAVTEADRSIVPRSTSRMSVNRLEPGAEHQLTFRFAATEISTTRSYDIGFTVTYETGATDTGGAAETVTFTQFQGVNIFNPEPDDSNDTDDGPTRISTPRIIVSDYVSNPMIVQAGQEFDLELTFLNTSERIVRNIRVTLTVEDEVTAGNERRGSVFTPVGRSSTFFIDRIDPRSEVVEHIRFF